MRTTETQSNFKKEMVQIQRDEKIKGESPYDHYHHRGKHKAFDIKNIKSRKKSRTVLELELQSKFKFKNRPRKIRYVRIFNGGIL